MGARSARDDRVTNREKGREGGPSSGVNFQSCNNTMREERAAIFHSVVTGDNNKKKGGVGHQVTTKGRSGLCGGREPLGEEHATSIHPLSLCKTIGVRKGNA